MEVAYNVSIKSKSVAMNHNGKSTRQDEYNSWPQIPSHNDGIGSHEGADIRHGTSAKHVLG